VDAKNGKMTTVWAAAAAGDVATLRQMRDLINLPDPVIGIRFFLFAVGFESMPCPSACLSACPSVRVSVLSLCLFVDGLSVCLSSVCPSVSVPVCVCVDGAGEGRVPADPPHSVSHGRP
jgi:hypothetical protein